MLCAKYNSPCPWASTCRYYTRLPLTPTAVVIMSHPASASTSSFRFQSIFDSALDAYKKRTNQDLASHPLLTRLQSCDSADAILTLLQDQLPVHGQSKGADDRLAKLLMPTINVLYAFSAALAEGVGIVNTKCFLLGLLR